MKGLKAILLPIVLLFIIVVGRIEIVLGQPSLTNTDSCICYTDAMDKKALECLVNAPKKDSLISNYGLQILNFKTIVANQETILGDNEITIQKLNDENQKINLRLVSAVRNVKFFGVGGLVVGVIGTVLLIK